MTNSSSSPGKSSKRKSKSKVSKEMDDINNNEFDYEESIRLTKQPNMLKNGELQPH